MGVEPTGAHNGPKGFRTSEIRPLNNQSPASNSLRSNYLMHTNTYTPMSDMVADGAFVSSTNVNVGLALTIVGTGATASAK